MKDAEAIWREFVMGYDLDVPEDLVENELRYITLEMKHRMQYDTLTGGGHHFDPRGELAGQEEELRQAAFFEAKSDLVMKAILADKGITVTREELEAEAAALAQRQGATIEQVKGFFGEDLAMLERDVKERKAMDWVCAQFDT